jgi:hypothetical protein
MFAPPLLGHMDQYALVEKERTRRDELDTGKSFYRCDTMTGIWMYWSTDSEPTCWRTARHEHTNNQPGY